MNEFAKTHWCLSLELLDWTTDIYIALWFATEKSQVMSSYADIVKDVMDYSIFDIKRYELSDDFSAVYIINPCEINKRSMDFKNIKDPVDVDEHYDLMKSYLSTGVRPLSPLCIKGKDIDVRLRNQKGNFTKYLGN